MNMSQADKLILVVTLMCRKLWESWRIKWKAWRMRTRQWSRNWAVKTTLLTNLKRRYINYRLMILMSKRSKKCKLTKNVLRWSYEKWKKGETFTGARKTSKSWKWMRCKRTMRHCSSRFKRCKSKAIRTEMKIQSLYKSWKIQKNSSKWSAKTWIRRRSILSR